MGCDGKPADQPVAKDVKENDTYVYWHCPSHFIPKSVYAFFEIYNYYKSFTGANAGSYFSQPKIFIDACNVYESELNMYRNKIDNIKKPKRPRRM